MGSPPKLAKPWVATQTGKTLGCHPNRQNLGLPPKLASGQNQDLGLAAQTGPKGALTRAPSGHPRFLTARYRSLAIFQRLRLVPQTPPLRGTLISDSNLLEKKLSLFLITHSTSF
ncbi:hypothetical protein J1782_02340 [Rahnella sp. BCC 1045]|uniref:hypothetical protein n=1 Tax=Rahnella sp. BCC 1045 TaxID=2816251 RepID=UPI001C25F913|nr:hypothetical protein [Rahnella sp. BCC 1045]MBU9818728.1 hypothetical protein [Rahnella sp. BCC 1045]